MSVYKRPGKETYTYDFECGAVRFSGDTGKTSKREAARVQELERARIKALQREGRFVPGSDISFGAAATRYFLEVGQYHVNADSTLAALEWLEAAIGKKTLCSQIDDEFVARIVARRRGEYRRVGNDKTLRRLVGSATVNRTATEPLRKVLLRAGRVWKARVGDVDWRQHLLKEPRERVREASPGEEAAITGALQRGYDAALRFAFLSGCRKKELLPKRVAGELVGGLRWTAVDFFGRQFTVIGKGNKLRTIPMSQAIYDLLWGERHHHPVFVFTYAAARTLKARKIYRGQRYPLLLSGWSIAVKRGTKRAGVVNFTPHDTRHTAATRVLRASNMKVVQNLLGHDRITTTEKYTHAVAEDVRAALDAVSPTGIPTTAPDATANPKPTKNDQHSG